MSVLIAAPEGQAPTSWPPLLHAASLTLAGTAGCHNLVREAVRLAPEAVILALPAWTASWGDALHLLAESAAVPVLLVGPAELPAVLDDWSAWGLGAWLPGEPSPLALVHGLRLAKALHAQRRAVQHDLQAARAALDERKWVDRAKGMLMQHQQLSEPAAFALLRTASMQANLRVGEVSRGVVEAAQAADAVNRAGQLRMLSQRLVKALAQGLAGVERHRADALLSETAQRLDANLLALGAGVMPGSAAALLASVVEAWAGLQAALPEFASRLAGRQPGAAGASDPSGPAGAVRACNSPARATAGLLLAADAHAEALLQAADALTSALERHSGRPHLQVINTCGRQRMLSQRLSKQALLAGLLSGPDAQAQAQAAAHTVQAFEVALAQLEQAPLSTAAIRTALAHARGQWQRLLEGVRQTAQPGDGAHAARLVIAREGEGLLASFEQLTTLYEHSMQVLLG